MCQKNGNFKPVKISSRTSTESVEGRGKADLVDLCHDAFHEQGFEDVSAVAGKLVGQILNHHAFGPHFEDLFLQIEKAGCELQEIQAQTGAHIFLDSKLTSYRNAVVIHRHS